MTPNVGLRVSHGFARWSFIGMVALASHCAVADALDTWTSHMFPEIRVASPGFSCFQPTTNGTRSVTNAIPWLDKVLFKDGLFVAVGTGPCAQDTPTVILRTADGFNWLRSTNSGFNGFYGATVTPDLFIGVGFWGQVLLSGNGVDWRGAGAGLGANLNAVAVGSNRLVAASGIYAGDSQGMTGVLFTATVTASNVSNWAQATVSGRAVGEFVTVAYGNGRFAAATSNRIFRSTGTLGTSTNFFPVGSASGARLLCFGNDRFVLVGDDLRVCTNLNGSFAPATLPTPHRIDTLTFGAGMFVGTAERDVLTSIDGFNWTVRPNVLAGRASDLAFGNGVFMAASVPSGLFSGNEYYISQPIAALSPGTNGTLLVHGVKGREYDIHGTNLLAAGSWPVLGRIRLTNSPQAWVDGTAAANGARFYRTQLVLAPP